MTQPQSYSYGHVQTITYNGQNFPFPTVGLSGTARYDETGRVITGFDLTFTVNCIFVGEAVGGDSTIVNFQKQLQTFLNAISTPGKAFKWSAGGKYLWWIEPASNAPVGVTDVTHIDRAWGPKPKNVTCNTITAMQSARVQWQMDTFVKVCNDSFLYTINNDLVEFSWTWDYAFDRNFVCTRSVNGKYKFRSNINAALSLLSNVAFFPALATGFYRESMRHSLSPDGTELTFTVVDRQVWRTLPRPITSGFATFRIDQQAAALTKTLQCSFEAPTDIDKKTIASFISALIRYRFPNANNLSNLSDLGDTSKGEWITQFSLTNHEFENRMDCTVTSNAPATVLLNASGKAAAPFGLILDVLDIEPNATDTFKKIDLAGVSEFRSMTGTAGEVPQPAPEIAICSSAQSNASAPAATSTPATGTPDPGTSASDQSEGDTPDYVTSAAQDAYMYSKYIEQWHYFIDRHYVQMKTASAGTDFVQQTMKATFRILQVGCAERIGKPPVIPSPAFVDHAEDGEYINLQDVRVHNPEFLSDGTTPIYKVNWSYDILVPTIQALSTQGAKMDNMTRVFLPADPRWDRTTATSRGSELDGKSIPFNAGVNIDGTFNQAIGNVRKDPGITKD